MNQYDSLTSSDLKNLWKNSQERALKDKQNDIRKIWGILLTRNLLRFEALSANKYTEVSANY
jgi:hypothetical protein